MSFDDFVTNYSLIMLAHVTPNTLAPIMCCPERSLLTDQRYKWEETTFEGYVHNDIAVTVHFKGMSTMTLQSLSILRACPQ